MPQTRKGKPNLKMGEGPVDPDELQLMDEYNERWVHAWKQATARPDASIKTVDEALLIESGFEYVAEMNAVKLLKKSK